MEDMIKYNKKPEKTLTISGVWDRRDLYVHASFANTTPWNYLGSCGEFYMTPSKFYKWTSKSNEFRIWFSFDAKTPQGLYWEQVIIQLQMLANVMR
jgi:hypothetical protein